jgi:hypothetical protein
MPISINPLDLLKLFRDKGITDRATIASYVEAVAADVLEASELWCEAIDAADRGASIAKTRIWQRMHMCESIDYHYRRASSVIQGRLSGELTEALFGCLGGYLKARDELLETERAMRLSLERRNIELTKMRALGDQLQVNAGRLRALALEIRSTT